MSVSTVPQAEHVHVDLDPATVVVAYARHRRRFAEAVKDLDATALAVQSRCSEWTIADVLRHGCDVDEWMQALWTSQPLPFTNFDPNRTPHEFVIKKRSQTDPDVRDRFRESSESMAAGVGTSGSERWGISSFSPMGVVPWWMSALHIFYDSWLHERDVLHPLGIETPVIDNEATAILAYSLALVGTFITDPTEIVVAGVRLSTSQPLTTTPVAPVIDASTGVIIDALNGRGDVEPALEAAAPGYGNKLGGLARFFLAR